MRPALAPGLPLPPPNPGWPLGLRVVPACPRPCPEGKGYWLRSLMLVRCSSSSSSSSRRAVILGSLCHVDLGPGRQGYFTHGPTFAVPKTERAAACQPGPLEVGSDLSFLPPLSLAVSWAPRRVSLVLSGAPRKASCCREALPRQG